MEEKKLFEEPVVTKVEFDFNELITASGCTRETGTYDVGYEILGCNLVG